MTDMQFISNADILESPAELITIPVNCVGVMGAGLALQAKQADPKMYREYRNMCTKKYIEPGKPQFYIYRILEPNFGRGYIFFPTKDHWRQPSKLKWIEEGLISLSTHIRVQNRRESIAIPPLGCGHGGLNWDSVLDLIIEHMTDVPSNKVYVYEPEIP